jgi:uncharacterized protein (DUF433 family)
MSTATATHIWLDDRNVAWIDDTNVKVIEIAMDVRAHGWSAEEIHYQHYRAISLAQIHAALAWYYDHQPEFDAEIERQRQHVESLRTKSSNSPGRQKLRGMGSIP